MGNLQFGLPFLYRKYRALTLIYLLILKAIDDDCDSIKSYDNNSNEKIEDKPNSKPIRKRVSSTLKDIKI